jgi:hypothetical protein
MLSRLQISNLNQQGSSKGCIQLSDHIKVANGLRPSLAFFCPSFNFDLSDWHIEWVEMWNDA